MKIEITKAEIKDLDAVEELYNDVCDYLADKEYNPHFTKGQFPARRNAECFLKEESLYVARVDGRIVGSVSMNNTPGAEVGDYNENSIQEIDNKALYLHIVVVHPDYMRHHISMEMLQFAEKNAKEQGLYMMRLFVWDQNSVAIKAYEKSGFVRKDKVDIGLAQYGLPWFYLYEKKIG